MSEVEFGPISWSFPVLESCIEAVRERGECLGVDVKMRASAGRTFAEVTGATTDQLAELMALSGLT